LGLLLGCGRLLAWYGVPAVLGLAAWAGLFSVVLRGLGFLWGCCRWWLWVILCVRVIGVGRAIKALW